MIEIAKGSSDRFPFELLEESLHLASLLSSEKPRCLSKSSSDEFPIAIPSESDGRDEWGGGEVTEFEPAGLNRLGALGTDGVDRPRDLPVDLNDIELGVVVLANAAIFHVAAGGGHRTRSSAFDGMIAPARSAPAATARHSWWSS